VWLRRYLLRSPRYLPLAWSPKTQDVDVAPPVLNGIRGVSLHNGQSESRQKVSARRSCHPVVSLGSSASLTLMNPFLES
jgi:hypothetical protein